MFLQPIFNRIRSDLASIVANIDGSIDIVALANKLTTIVGFADKGGEKFNVLAYGAVADVQRVEDALCSSTTSTIVTSATANFSSADIGKTCQLSNATTGTIGVITTIASVQSATQVTLAAAPGISVLTGTPNQVGYFVWGTDNTTAFQSACDAAYDNHGGTAWVPSKASGYLLSGTLDVKEGVQLGGAMFRRPPFWRYRVYDHGQVTITSTYPGAALYLLAGYGNAGGTAQFTLHNGAELRGLVFYYPCQTPTNPPIAYPWTVNANGGETGASLSSCLFVNSYQLFQAVNHDKFELDYVFGEPLLTGIYVDQMYDVSRMHYVHFWDFWARDDDTKTALNTWKFANTVHFKIQRADLIMCTDIFSINSYISLWLSHSASGDPWMSFNSFQCDAAVYPVYMESTADAGVLMTNVELSAYLLGGVSGTTKPVCIYVPDSATPNFARLKIMGGILTNPNASAVGQNLVYLGSGGTGTNRLELQNVDFTSVTQPTGSAAIVQKSTSWNVQVHGGSGDQYKGQYFWDVSTLPANAAGQRLVSGTHFSAAPTFNDPNTAGIHWSAVEDGTKPGARYGAMRRYDSNGFKVAQTINRTTSSGGWEQFQGSAEVVNTSGTPIPFYRITNTNIAGMPDDRLFLELTSDNCARLRLLGISGLAAGLTAAYGFTDGSDSTNMVAVTRDGALLTRGFATGFTTKSTAYTLDPAKDYQVNVSASGGAVAITLPAASSLVAGRRYVVIKTDSSANAVNLTPSGADTINGVNAAKALTSQWQSAELWTDAVGSWWCRTVTG